MVVLLWILTFGMAGMVGMADVEIVKALVLPSSLQKLVLHWL